MTWLPWKFFEQEWSITGTGVITVSEEAPGAGRRTQIFHCFGLALDVAIHDTLICGPGGSVVLSGVIVEFEVCDMKGKSHSLILSKDNLFLGKVGSTPRSPFTAAVAKVADEEGEMPDIDDFSGRPFCTSRIIHTFPTFVFCVFVAVSACGVLAASVSLPCLRVGPGLEGWS